MEKIETALPGVYILRADWVSDSRGWFMEAYSSKAFAAIGINDIFVQDNHSFTAARNTLRGFHFQNDPYAQAKIVRVIAGAVLDVAVDIRKGSPAYRRWIGVELSSENKLMLYIPRGFAHAYLTLTNNVEFFYKVNNLYVSAHDRCMRYDDPSIGVDWGTDAPILSDRDRNAPLLCDCGCNYIYNQ
ncbi:MAG: dTDP-4-dehydrorhamnose 3,5-epimerase [Oscillospiraceae bacterium]|nr:dTDP-4-dehydrorhamnose 3,5-epimerase [Oscillospiraceae bacterium]